VLTSKIHVAKRCNGAAHIGLVVQDAAGPSHTAHRPDRSGGTSPALAWLVPVDLRRAAPLAIAVTLVEALYLGRALLSV
jgi:hypothetical protein